MNHDDERDIESERLAKADYYREQAEELEAEMLLARAKAVALYALSAPPYSYADLRKQRDELLAALKLVCEVPNKNRPDRIWETAREAIANAEKGSTK